MDKIRWAPKLRQSKIWVLYQHDAQGLPDSELIADVGYDLLQRCRSIWLVTRREVECPRCGTAFALAEHGPWKLLPDPNPCPTPACGWAVTAEVWHASWRNHDLLGTAAMQAIEAYLRDYPLACSPEARMLCIDQLIHAFHISLRTGQLNRSVANNLIEGSHKQVVELLDRLFERPGGVDKAEWREAVDGMWRRRQGKDV